MATPVVSVILTTHNRARLIGRSLRSVLAQTHRDLEVLVVDDASTDDTESVVNAFGDPRVRYVRRSVNGGPPAARNEGLRLARGEFVAFQDDDDEWFLDKLELQLERMRGLTAEVAMTCCALVRYQSGDAAILYNALPAGEEAGAILRCNTLCFTQTWLARRSALVRCGGFDERLPLWDDWEIMIRVCQQFRVDWDNRVMCMVYDTPGSMIKQNLNRLRGMQLTIDKHRALMDAEPAALARNLYMLGRFHLLHGNASAGRQSLWRSLRLRPGDPKTAGLLALGLLGSGVVRGVTDALDRRRHPRPATSKT